MSDEESIENVSLVISLAVEKLLARNRHLKELCARAAEALDGWMTDKDWATDADHALLTELREAAK